MRDLQSATNFLGMLFMYDRKKHMFTLDQQAYTEGILSRFSMDHSKSKRTPLPEGIHLEKEAEGYKAEASKRTYYQQMIGSLIYLMIGT